MNKEEVISFFEKSGYKPYPVPRFDSDGVVWTASKRLPEGSTECDTNNHKISWHVKVHEFQIENSNKMYQSVEIEIVANKKDRWVSLKSYGIRWEDLEKQIPAAERCLLNAWEATARS